MSFEIVSYSQIIKNVKEKPVEEQTEVVYTDAKFKNLKISNQAVDKFLNDNYGDAFKPETKKAILCTKCKGSNFNTQEDLRKHFKTNWHKFNATLSAKGKESLSAEEYDEFILLHPEHLDK